ncbi:MAG TPA: hypothetical protein VN112_16220 [Ensifer sp.]|nr:hypothetical protein [Ensifer sp.]
MAIYETVASAATIDLGSYLNRKFIVTGTTDISSLGDTGTDDGVPISLFFEGALNIIPSASLLTPGHVSGTGTTTASSNSVTGVTNATSLLTGMFFWGMGIPAGATITGISGTTVTLSANANASGTVTYTAAPKIQVAADDQWVATCSGLAGVWSVYSPLGNFGRGQNGPGNLLRLDSTGDFSSSLRMPKTLLPIAASVAGNALTVTLNPCSLDFRSATANDGTITRVNLTSPISITVPSSATLGTVNGINARLLILAHNYGGVIELDIVNIAGGLNLDETAPITTTTISTGATSASTIYSNTGRSSVPYRVVGFIDINETTAGTWASAPVLVQGCGGQALAALSSYGFGQASSVQSRSAGVTYYNPTGKPITVEIRFNFTAGGTASMYRGGVLVQYLSPIYSDSLTIAVMIPPGFSYSCSMTGVASFTWTETR